MMTRVTPHIRDWYFIHMDSGMVISEDTSHDILATAAKDGSIDTMRMYIGISGKSYSGDGLSAPVDGTRNQVINIRQIDGVLLITTANYQEFIAENPLSFYDAGFEACAAKLRTNT